VQEPTRLKGRENLISDVNTGDESCVYGYDLQTQQQSSQWRDTTPPNPEKSSRLGQTSRAS